MRSRAVSLIPLGYIFDIVMEKSSMEVDVLEDHQQNRITSFKITATRMGWFQGGSFLEKVYVLDLHICLVNSLKARCDVCSVECVSSNISTQHCIR